MTSRSLIVIVVLAVLDNNETRTSWTNACMFVCGGSGAGEWVGLELEGEEGVFPHAHTTSRSSNLVTKTVVKTRGGENGS